MSANNILCLSFVVIVVASVVVLVIVVAVVVVIIARFVLKIEAKKKPTTHACVIRLSSNLLSFHFLCVYLPH